MHMSVCVSIALSNLYFLLVPLIVNFHYDCYGEYHTIANFIIDLFTICVDECGCVCVREIKRDR